MNTKNILKLSIVLSGLSWSFNSKALPLQCNGVHRTTSLQANYAVQMRTEPDPIPTKYLMKILNIDKASAQKLAMDFESARVQTLRKRSPELVKEDIQKAKDPNWVLDMVQYMGYVNYFGDSAGHGTFATTKKMAPYLKDLGVNTFYALPFLESPFGDAGFDVSHYRKVDPRFGTNNDLAGFMKDLKHENGLFQMDLVLNHISNQHEWAQKALAGDPVYRKYFHILESPPEVISVKKNAEGKPVEATYREADASGHVRNITRRVIFPDFADPAHPHYTKVKDQNGKDIWVYHTFYPFQYDLNYTNPNVIKETFAIMGYWANKGVDVFRLDAIPFLIKDQESDPRTYQIVQLLNYFLKQVAPRTVLKVEACQAPETIIQFYGQNQKIFNYHINQWVDTTSGAQIAYHFDLMPTMFASLLSGEKKYVEKVLKETPALPEGGAWGIFLRVHDELTLEMATPEVRSVIQKSLLETHKGVSFRGDLGVAGRLADFLDRDPKRVTLAYSLLLTQKGIPILYYGDEVMAGNNYKYAETAAQERGGAYDARDVNRGPIDASQFFNATKAGNKSPEALVYQWTRRMISIRNKRVSLRRGESLEIPNDSANVMTYLRDYEGKEKTLVVQNLAGEARTVKLQLKAGDTPASDLLTGKKVSFRKLGDQIEIKLEPYQALWIDVLSKPAL